MSADRFEVAERPRPDGDARDGVGEHDNPIPLWFNVGFYGLMVVGVIYILYYTLSGWSQLGQYQAEVERSAQLAAAARAAAPVPTANPYRGDAAALAEGKEVFATICLACHLADGRGLVGPSLVDPYWKYGHDDAALFETVSSGRPAGMPPWGAQLGAEKIWKVLAYIETLPRSSAPGLGAPDYQPPAPAAPSGGG
jgi:cytochrome c oxidase cbb3-type subunit 3